MALNLRAFRENGDKVNEGDAIYDHRGQAWTFISVTSHGKIYARHQGDGHAREFFKQVFQLNIKDSE